MAEKKQKSRDEAKLTKSKNTVRGNGAKRRKSSEGDDSSQNRKKSGPRLTHKLRKDVDFANRNNSDDDDEEEIDSDFELRNDVYEYEEGVPEEESRKNKRFDPVDNFDYELPDDFKDENIPSDDDVIGSEEDDDGRHARMLQGITGITSEAFEGKKAKRDYVISEAYPESEYNSCRDVLDGDGHISIHDLLNPLHGSASYSKLRKRTRELEKDSISVHAPLSKADQDRLERKVAYEHSKKEISQWEPLVKRNREAPTVYFNEDTNLGFSTVGAMASRFDPKSDFEKNMAAIVNDERVVEAHRNDGSKILELCEISVKEVKERHDHLAKMRSLLFRHELKAKHIKKIKSKTYHRLLKKDKLKAVAAEMQMNPEAAKELAEKQEFKRAEERYTLKHGNKSKWAKRILRRGLDAQDEGTRAAISEQLNQHALLKRKMNSMKDNSSSSDDSSDEDDDEDASAGSDQDGPAKLLARAKEKTLKVLEGEDEMPSSGVLSLPFMVRGMKKRNEAINEEAKLALQDYEMSVKQLDNASEAKGSSKVSVSSGRRVFGAAKMEVQNSGTMTKREIDYGSNSDEDDFKTKENIDIGLERSNNLQKDADIDVSFLREDSEIVHDPLFKSFSDIVQNPGPKTTYDVAIIATDLGKKRKKKSEAAQKSKKLAKAAHHSAPQQDIEEEVTEDGDSDSDGQMVDGILTSGDKSTYEPPSQAELIRRAFAGDDVEDDFKKDKQEVLNEENPEPEKPKLIPGWGQWADIQEKKGLPRWMVKKYENDKKEGEEALKLRKDARLKNVIISEKLDKKALKLQTKTVPYPYTSQEVFERSTRMPIGPEYNPASMIGALNRPHVVKRAGVIIRPIQFEEVNPHENGVEHRKGSQKRKSKPSGGNNQKKMKK